MSDNFTGVTPQFPQVGSVVLYHEDMQGGMKTSVAIVDKVADPGDPKGKLSLTVFTPDLVNVVGGDYSSIPFGETPSSCHWTWPRD